MNDLMKYLMAWGGLGWPGGGLGVAWSDFTIREPSGNQQKTIRDLEAGWTAGWAALGWPGLLLGWVAILGWLGLAWLANRNLKIW